MLFVFSTSIVHEVCPIDVCLGVGCNFTSWICWERSHTTYISFQRKGPHVGVHKERARNYGPPPSNRGRERTLSFLRTRIRVWTWLRNKTSFAYEKNCKETKVIYVSPMVGETHMYLYNSHNERYCIYLFCKAISTLKPNRVQ